MAKRIWFICFCVVASWSLVHAQGYRMEPDRIVVEGEDWKAWDQPKGVLETDEDGWLKPRFVRKNINACLDATQFEGGVKDAGTSLADVANAMDGNMDTFWEPDKDAPLKDWWFEIDLGRCVSATKIVLKFVEEGAGDPFYQFKVETTLQGKPSEGAPMIYYKMAGKTIQPNEHQRIFEFELSVPSWMCSDAFRGDVIQYVRVRVMGTRGGKAEKISEAEYKVLDPEDRGVVAYYRITAAGKEELTDQEGYEKLPPEQKGSVRYYRRERPRLAEMEVWCIGENLSLGIGNREGKIEGKGMDAVRVSMGFDGDFTTGYRTGVHSFRENWTLIDLGATFWVETIRLITGAQKYARSPIKAYQIRISEEVSESTSWVTMVLRSEEDIDESIFYFEDRWPPRKARLIEFRNLTPISLISTGTNFAGWKYTAMMKEFQIYGEGYVPEIPLTSRIIEVGKSRNLTSVMWEADIPPGTSVEVQTRTGDTLGEKKHYFNRDGVEVTEYQWRYKLPGFMKGPVKTEPIPGSDWSPWSRAYEHSGDRFQSPSPKKYLQIRVKLLSDDPYQAPSLKSLSIPFTVPLTEAITGTRSPKEVQRLGAPEVFTIRIHPILQEWHPGFNQLYVQTLDMMEMELLKLEVRKDSVSTDWTDSVEILPTHPDTLWIVLPDTIQAGDTDEIVLQFRSALYRDGTVFNLFVGNTSLPEVYQQVESEDYHAYSKTFMVFAPEKNRNMIDNVRLVPPVITPNGDGINDVLTVYFTVGRIQAERPVRLTMYDLSGKKVRHIVERRPKYPLGKYAMEWDGRDEEGRLVPPGVYLVVIRVKSNWYAAENTKIVRRVYVVY